MDQYHLSTAELLTYRENIGSTGSIRIGRHLLVCKECRSKLPAVTPGEFRACVSGSDLIFTMERSLPSLTDITHSTRLWSVVRITAFAGLAIFLLAGVYFVGVHRTNISDDIVAKNEENTNGNQFDPSGEEPVFVPSSLGKDPSERVSPNSESDAKSLPSSDETNPISLEPKLHVSSSESNKNKKVMDRTRKLAAARNYAVSATRGLPSRCGDAGRFEMGFENIEQTHVLKWKKFPNALKYHLYISDDDEILIDEFETELATSYSLTKPLDAKKSYSWKVIITLANGKTMNVATQKFSSLDFLSVQNGAIHKTRALTRCSLAQ